MKDKLRSERSGRLRVTWRDAGVSVGIFAGCTAVCLLLRQSDSDGEYASELFLLAVFLISRFTDGYVCGIAASLLSVLAVNFLFTFPYFEFNFTISGYPLTIVCMLVVSVVTSAMTTQIKRQSRLRIEAEREKTRGNLLRAVSHDLRTPLTGILGASSAIADTELPPEACRRLAREIGSEAQWLIRMVENLLSVTRVDDGGRPVRLYKQPEAAEEVVSAAVVQLQKRFPAQAVRVRVPDELLLVPMDAMLIEQVLLNLLENAVLHAAGATEIQLTVTRRGGEAVFAVLDDGCGIDPQLLPRLFEKPIGREEQGDRRRSLGIGLTVCNTIIRAHSGRMSARNRSGGGAAVEFTLPLEENPS